MLPSAKLCRFMFFTVGNARRARDLTGEYLGCCGNGVMFTNPWLTFVNPPALTPPNPPRESSPNQHVRWEGSDARLPESVAHAPKSVSRPGREIRSSHLPAQTNFVCVQTNVPETLAGYGFIWRSCSALKLYLYLRRLLFDVVTQSWPEKMRARLVLAVLTVNTFIVIMKWSLKK